MRAGLVLRQNLFLIRFRQPDVAMSMAVDVHEHRSTEEEGVFMYSRILPLAYAWQAEDSLSQFLAQHFWRFCSHGLT